MLPKSKRFTTEDFKKMRNTQTMHAPHFFIRFYPVPAGNEKTAVIVSSGTYKRAVDRNKLRRRMYHLVAKHNALLSGRALTATFKKGALDMTFTGLENELLALFPQKATHNRRP